MPGEDAQFAKGSTVTESSVNGDVPGPKGHSSSPCHHSLAKENPRGANSSLQICIKPGQQFEIILMTYLPSHLIHTPYLCQRESPGPELAWDNRFSPTMSLGKGCFCKRLPLGAFMLIISSSPPNPPERQV